MRSLPARRRRCGERARCEQSPQRTRASSCPAACAHPACPPQQPVRIRLALLTPKQAHPTRIHHKPTHLLRPPLPLPTPPHPTEPHPTPLTAPPGARWSPATWRQTWAGAPAPPAAAARGHTAGPPHAAASRRAWTPRSGWRSPRAATRPPGPTAESFWKGMKVRRGWWWCKGRRAAAVRGVAMAAGGGCSSTRSGRLHGRQLPALRYAASCSGPS